MLADYSKRPRPKLAQFDALDTALARVAADTTAKPRTRPVSTRQRYRLIDRFGQAKLDEIVARYEAADVL